MKLIFHLFLLLPFFQVTAADQLFVGQLETAYYQCLALELDQAQQLLDAHPNKSDPNFHYVSHIHDVIDILIGEDPSKFSVFKEREDAREDIFDDLSSDNPQKLFYLAELKLHSAFIKLKFGEEVSAGFRIVAANSNIKKNIKLFPDFAPNLKTLAFMNVIAGSVPDNYKWVVRMLGIDGDLDVGLKNLDQLKKQKAFEVEAIAFKTIVLSYLLDQNDEAVKSLAAFYKTTDNHLGLSFVLAATYQKNYQSEAALNVLEELSPEKFKIMPFLLYHQGEIQLRKGNYQKAIALYDRFATLQKGKSHIKDATYKKSLAYAMMGDKKQGMAFFNKAKSIGSVTNEVDRHAEKMLEKNILPNPEIMQLRLATDGGYFASAQVLLNKLEKSTLSIADKVELIYRRGRLLQLQDQFDLAIPEFLTVQRSQISSATYFKANASLQLGHIYAEMGKKEEAIAAYQEALEAPDHEYKYSIDNKAKAGIKRLRRS